MTSAVRSYSEFVEQAWQFIRRHDDFLVVSHVSPDGDAAGSLFAAGLLLAGVGKTFTLINEGEIPGKFACLPGYDSARNYSAGTVTRQFSAVICLDCADYSRIGKVSSLFAADVALLNIDHHSTNDEFGQVNLVRSDAASTTEVLFDMIEHAGIDVSVELAVCIYAGLLTDTGGFRYANTTVRVMEVAARLLAVGVRGHELAEQLLEKITRPHISLLKESLATLAFDEQFRICWMTVSAETVRSSGAQSEDLDGLVNYPRNIEGIEVGILFKQVDEATVKVSLRSAGEVDVSAVAKSFGGGGHMRAAGCTIYGTLEQAVGQVVQKVGSCL